MAGRPGSAALSRGPEDGRRRAGRPPGYLYKRGVMRLVQVVHGFPPRENAGTERVAAAEAVALRARGWFVHTLAATRSPGARMYREIEEPGVSRLVNNTPYAGVRRADRDPTARRWLERRLERLQPDVVHVHHTAYLDVDFVAAAPVVWTLHDAWAWCAAGGQLFRDGAPCSGPGHRCASCATAWTRDGPAATALLGAAGRLSSFIPGPRLHGAWSRVPGRLRALATRGAAPVTPAAIGARTAAYREFARRAAAIVTPSAWLAAEAARQGIGGVRVLPNGVRVAERRSAVAADAPFLFLGTIAAHKGPDLVRAAHARSGVSAPLRIVGPPGPDAAFVARIGAEPAVADAEALLRAARALVLGSRWPENAPMVVLEARAVGCPVIAPAIGGLPELVEPGVDGWLYAPGDEGSLAEAIVAASCSPALPVRPPCGHDAHIEALLAVYASVAGRGG